jgi:ABC-type proline/glycine betaine transport system ATPase subunit
MISRLAGPASGRIWLDDRNIASIKPAELRRGMGAVIRQAGLFPHKPVVDNIATVPRTPDMTAPLDAPHGGDLLTCARHRPARADGMRKWMQGLNDLGRNT